MARNKARNKASDSGHDYVRNESDSLCRLQIVIKARIGFPGAEAPRECEVAARAHDLCAVFVVWTSTVQPQNYSTLRIISPCTASKLLDTAVLSACKAVWLYGIISLPICVVIKTETWRE